MDPKQRFSGRADNYARHRPGYPRAVLDLLEDRCGLAGSSVVADVASGTGLLSELFLDSGNRVFGVEPNTQMRLAGERYLAEYADFVSVAGTAEATTLSDASVDLVVVGHAFHWFDPERARAEFARILGSGGCVALLWNETRGDATPFMRAYERFIRTHRTAEYESFDLEREVRGFFEPEGFERCAFRHRQNFDLEGLQGRLLSSSYLPDEGEAGYGAMTEGLEQIFREHSVAGGVAVEYETLLYFGKLG